MNAQHPAQTDSPLRRAPVGVRCARSIAATALSCLASFAALACPTLTPGGAITPAWSRYLLDDEGFAATPWNLQISQVGTNGAITGTMTTNVYGGTDYPVNGTVTGSGTLEIAFSYHAGGNPNIPATGTTYNYSGAIMYGNTGCPLFIAGTYTATTYSLEETRFGPMLAPHTSAPMPFSGQWAPILW